MKKDIIIGVLSGTLIAGVIYHKRRIKKVREWAIAGCMRAYENND